MGVPNVLKYFRRIRSMATILPGPIQDSLRTLWKALGGASKLTKLVGLQSNIFIIETEVWHSRVHIFNLESPVWPDEAFDQVPLVFRLYSPEGKKAFQRRYSLSKNETLCVEMEEFIGNGGLKRPYHGLLEVDIDAPAFGSMRAWTHWYSSHCLTTTHETPSHFISEKAAGYYTMTKVLVGRRFSTYMGIINLGDSPYSTKVTVLPPEGDPIDADMPTIPPKGSAFVRINDLHPDLERRLDGTVGSLYLENYQAPLLINYFIHDMELDCWQAQHL